MLLLFCLSFVFTPPSRQSLVTSGQQQQQVLSNEITYHCKNGELTKFLFKNRTHWLPQRMANWMKQFHQTMLCRWGRSSANEEYTRSKMNAIKYRRFIIFIKFDSATLSPGAVRSTFYLWPLLMKFAKDAMLMDPSPFRYLNQVAMRDACSEESHATERGYIPSAGHNCKRCPIGFPRFYFFLFFIWNSRHEICISQSTKRRKILAITRLVWRSMGQKALLHPPIFAHGLPISPLFFLAGLFFVRFLCVRARVFFFYSCWNSGTYSGNSKDIYK